MALSPAGPPKPPASASVPSSRAPKTSTVGPKRSRKRNAAPGTETRKSTASSSGNVWNKKSHLILLLDLGGDSVKHGVLTHNVNRISSEKSKISAQEESDLTSVKYKTCPNRTGKLKHQLTVLVGDQLLRESKNKLIFDAVSRSMERGTVVNMETQLKVVKRICDLSNLIIRPPTDLAEVYQWNTAAAAAAGAIGGAGNVAKTRTIQTAVMVLVPPFTPRTLLDRFEESMFGDLGFGGICFQLAQSMSARHYLSKQREQNLKFMADAKLIKSDEGGTTMMSDDTGCVCVVDVGFSNSHVVPTVEAAAVECAIRRIPLGGKHLTNLWKYQLSYRQVNVMDEFDIVNQLKEELGFILSSEKEVVRELAEAKRVPAGRRWYDREFVLPDFVQHFRGHVRLPRELILLQERQEHEKRMNQKRRMEALQPIEREERVSEKETGEEKNDDEEEGTDASSQQDDDVDSEEEESLEGRRAKILKRRHEEELRRQQQAEQEQAMLCSVERFYVPEVLFRPSDIDLVDICSLPQAIVQSIQACPEGLRAAMYRNIVLTGGTTLLSGFKTRLEAELRPLVPTQYDVIRITLPDDPIGYAWEGGALSVNGSNNKVDITDRSDWEARLKSRDWSRWEREKKEAKDGLVLL